MAHDMNRRGFLRSSLLLAGGLLVGDEALEAFARLTHQRKSFPSARVPVFDSQLANMMKQLYHPQVYTLSEDRMRAIRLNAGNRKIEWGGVAYTFTAPRIEPEWLRYGA